MFEFDIVLNLCQTKTNYDEKQKKMRIDKHWICMYKTVFLGTEHPDNIIHHVYSDGEIFASSGQNMTKQKR